MVPPRSWSPVAVSWRSTLQVEFSAIAQLTHYDEQIERPELKYMNPLVLNAFWRKPNNPYLRERADPAFFEHLYADEKILVMTLYMAGVHVVAGTDLLNPMTVPGVRGARTVYFQSAGGRPARPIRR